LDWEKKMAYNRREFLGVASTLLTTSATVPAFLERTARAAARESAPKDRVLVVLQLTGGNDGLNTVVPFADDNYCRRRPKLNLAKAKLHKLDGHIGLHPDLQGLKKLYDAGLAGIVQSVGYPNPNRSHFESMAIWNLAPNDAQLSHGKASDATGGWLARAIDERGSAATGSHSTAALRVGAGEMPRALLGCRVPVPSLASQAQLKSRSGLLDRRSVEQQVAAWQRNVPAAGNSLLRSAIESSVAVYATARQIERINPESARRAKYPSSELGERFRLIGQLIKAGFATSIYYTEHSGFDTHATQLFTHARALQTMGGAVQAFVDDIRENAPSRQVLVLVFSEFGRRLTENASEGTDHGTAAPVFLAGHGVVPGIHGPYPDLEHLVDGDPVFAVDFRRVYAAVLDQWLGLSSERILNQRFEPLGVVKGRTA
jgi:uncharacterized protein (DUF1501 family)